MRILVTGATGLIGGSLCARLVAEGHKVVRVVRRPPLVATTSRTVIVDMAAASQPEDWSPYLNGVDAVVNCAGVLQDSATEKTHAVHRYSTGALFRACEEADVHKVIHFSAIGVDRSQPSAFSESKLAGDQLLMERKLDWVILRPSVVLGRPAFGASALFRGLAGLPVLPSMPGTGRLQVVQLDDVISTVVFFLQPAKPSRVILELVGPEALAMDDIVGAYRHWFGWPEARRVVLPRWTASLLYRLGDLAGMLGWRPPMRTNAAKEIARGATGDPSEWTAMTGITPRSLANALTAPASVQEKWFSRLYFLKPLIFVVLPFFWIMTGIISLTAGFETGVELMRRAGAGVLSVPSVIAGAIADIVVGALIACRPSTRRALQGAIALSAFYGIAATILRPDLWSEPLGPLLKIFPILVLHAVALAILEER